MSAPDIDPIDTPLPCHVTVGHVTMHKGVRLRTLVMRMQALYNLAVANAGDQAATHALSSDSPSDRAVLHILQRLQKDPRLAYLIGPGSKSFDLVITAAAKAQGIEHDVLRERVLGLIAPQPVPGIGMVAGVIDPELLARIAAYDGNVHDLDSQLDLDMLVNHFVRRGLDVAEAERDTQTEELF